MGVADQPDVGVEDCDQVVKVAGARRVARRFAQLRLRAHLALDDGAGLG